MYIHIVENVKASQSKIECIHHTRYAPPAVLVCLFGFTHYIYSYQSKSVM